MKFLGCKAELFLLGIFLAEVAVFYMLGSGGVRYRARGDIPNLRMTCFLYLSEIRTFFMRFHTKWTDKRTDTSYQ